LLQNFVHYASLTFSASGFLSSIFGHNANVHGFNPEKAAVKQQCRTPKKEFNKEKVKVRLQGP
jgi:hypothetical protein